MAVAVAVAVAAGNGTIRAMSPTSSVSRTGEYVERGDYHRELSKDSAWSFLNVLPFERA